MPSPNLAALVSRLRVPTPLKLFADSVRGKKEPITEADFAPEELDAMLKLTQSTPSGAVQYPAYGDSFLEAPGVPGLLTAKGRVANSLGQFNHSADDDATTIKDQYDFNRMYKNENPLVQALHGLGSGGFAFAHMLGETVLPPGQGRPVNIRIPHGR